MIKRYLHDLRLKFIWQQIFIFLIKTVNWYNIHEPKVACLSRIYVSKLDWSSSLGDENGLRCPNWSDEGHPHSHMSCLVKAARPHTDIPHCLHKYGVWGMVAGSDIKLWPNKKWAHGFQAVFFVWKCDIIPILWSYHSHLGVGSTLHWSGVTIWTWNKKMLNR